MDTQRSYYTLHRFLTHHFIVSERSSNPFPHPKGRDAMHPGSPVKGRIRDVSKGSQQRHLANHHPGFGWTALNKCCLLLALSHLVQKWLWVKPKLYANLPFGIFGSIWDGRKWHWMTPTWHKSNSCLLQPNLGDNIFDILGAESGRPQETRWKNRLIQVGWKATYICTQYIYIYIYWFMMHIYIYTIYMYRC